MAAVWCRAAGRPSTLVPPLNPSQTSMIDLWTKVRTIAFMTTADNRSIRDGESRVGAKVRQCPSRQSSLYQASIHNFFVPRLGIRLKSPTCMQLI